MYLKDILLTEQEFFVFTTQLYILIINCQVFSLLLCELVKVRPISMLRFSVILLEKDMPKVYDPK